MTEKNRFTLKIVAEIKEGKIRRKDAMKILDVSERTLHRYLIEYEKI
jgi:DeoR/GlpR family transcriptional regulator of sugar metabolism